MVIINPPKPGDRLINQLRYSEIAQPVTYRLLVTFFRTTSVKKCTENCSKFQQNQQFVLIIALNARFHRYLRPFEEFSEIRHKISFKTRTESASYLYGGEES